MKKKATTKRSAKKSTAKKPIAKKAIAKKPITKKPITKKPIAKKPIAKKPIAKKPIAKQRPKKAGRPREAPAPSSDRRSAAERIDAMIAGLGDWRGERLAEIRAFVHEVDPEVLEEWKWMGTPVWSHEGMYVLANAHKGKVKVMFFHGARLPDPKGLFNASLEGNRWRAIDLREADRLPRAAFKALLRAAIAYNRSHPVPKSRGSRA